MPSLLRVPKKCSKNTKLSRRYFFERFGELKRSGTMRPPIPLNRRGRVYVGLSALMFVLKFVEFPLQSRLGVVFCFSPCDVDWSL